MIVRIDQQLKEKVDFDNIGEFERKLDEKISGNLNKKFFTAIIQVSSLSDFSQYNNN